MAPGPTISADDRGVSSVVGAGFILVGAVVTLAALAMLFRSVVVRGAFDFTQTYVAVLTFFAGLFVLGVGLGKSVGP